MKKNGWEVILAADVLRNAFLKSDQTTSIARSIMYLGILKENILDFDEIEIDMPLIINAKKNKDGEYEEETLEDTSSQYNNTMRTCVEATRQLIGERTASVLSLACIEYKNQWNEKTEQEG